VEENYNDIGLGPREDHDKDRNDEEYDEDEEYDDVIFDTPRESANSRPFSIDLDFNSYRKNKEYQSALTAGEMEWESKHLAAVVPVER